MYSRRVLVLVLAGAVGLAGCGKSTSSGQAPPAKEPQKFSIGGGVLGLTAGGLVLQDNGGDDLAVPSGAVSFKFAALVASGAAYAVTVKAQPTGLTCTVDNSTGTVANADVSNANVSCTNVVQRWAAPTTWGGLWPASPTMVQHAHFDGQSLVEDGKAGIGWTLADGIPPAQTELKAFPSGSRFGAGPFTGQIYQANAGTDAALDAMTGDMLVCAVIKPDFNPTMAGDDHEKPIIARGEGHDNLDVPGGGWVLMQMHSFFCFHYEFLDSTNTSHMHMAIVPTSFADHQVAGQGPLEPTYVVFCGGRDGNTIRSAVNAARADGNLYSDSVTDLGTGQITLDKGSHRLVIGGYEQDVADRANHVFGGRVYETAVWNEAATPANIQAKLDAIQGIASGGTYLRSREGWFSGADGALHAAWWDGPRIDASRGFLFGLQSFNHLGYAVAGMPGMVNDLYAPGEDMGLWTAAGGATVAATADLQPPGDSGVTSAKRVTLPPGGSLETPLAAFDTVGAVHGQIWLSVPAATVGTLQLVTDQPAAGGSATFNVDLSTLAPATWTRIWLKKGSGDGNELTTNGNAGHFTIAAPSANTANVQFYAWGVDLTQLGSLPTANANGANVGVDLGSFDPGQAMYDWMGATTSIPGGATNRYPLDVLLLPPITASTPAGFCLSADASTPDGLPWAASFTRPRTIVAWVNDPFASPPATTAKIYMDGAVHTGATPNEGKLCFSVTGAPPVCAAVPGSFAAGSAHTIKGCMSSAGDISLFADGNPIAEAAGGIATPDLDGGTLLVGAALAHPDFDGNPWNGWVSKAVVCHFGDTCQ